MCDRSKKGYTFPLYLFKNQKHAPICAFIKNTCTGMCTTGRAPPPVHLHRWRSKDCNLKRAAPSDVWGNLCIIVTTRKVMAGKSRWLMGFPLDRCGIAPAIAAILAPTSLSLFPWNVPIVLNMQFSRSRKYFLLYTPNMKFSLLVVTHFLRVACKPAVVQRGLGRAPKFAFGYPNAMLAKLTGLGNKDFCGFYSYSCPPIPGWIPIGIHPGCRIPPLGFLLESLPEQVVSYG